MSSPYAPARPAQRRGLAVASLVLGIVSLPTLGCLGVGALAGIVLGIVALVKIGKAPAEYGGKGLAIAGIATSVLSLAAIPFIGVFSAIAIPSLLRARVSANEAATIGDVRAVMSAQAAYQSANKGFYDTPQCLAAPAQCIPGYRGPAFLDSELAALSPKNGYAREFHAGPAAEAEAAISPSSLTSYAYTAAPLQKGRTGGRAFCGDSSGRVCFRPDGEAPTVTDGACDPSCEELR